MFRFSRWIKIVNSQKSIHMKGQDWFKTLSLLRSYCFKLTIIHVRIKPYFMYHEHISCHQLPESYFDDSSENKFFLCFFLIMIYKYTFKTHISWLIKKKSTIIKLEHTKTRSIQNSVCLMELRILYNNL